ncbi:NAD-dependent epimerase/dehydratase family protein [Embleya scabrispora]|uniref:NAD-dependent epimerase/dehydratase family protein n=1 Tax=Embleya scabrispora TaxID=159449 RepID=UPI0003772445|nr:NAD-dependent epimerase/dehydratase family protein [Embleya scabrispora]MYS85537.1 NAD-dependent epimerase/dehydratase family protein [Streptomyces sp. SID5474]
MSTGSDLHVVLGAGGAVGGAVVDELVARGRRVRAVNRNGVPTAPDGVEVHRGDVTTADGAAAACAGGAVVYHCAAPAYTRWASEFPPMTDAIRRGAAAAGAKLVFADNLYMYGPVSAPMTEDMPYAAGFPKGRVRAGMARSLLAAHEAGELRVALGRASDYYGPRGVNSTVGETVFGAAVQGKVARWVGPLDQPHSFSYLPDFAKGLVVLGEDARADGHAWHIPTAEPVTGRQFLDMLFAELGSPGRSAAVGRTLQRVLGLVNPTVRALGETWYQRDRPFVVDAGRFTETFGPLPATSHAEAIAATVAWFRGARA